MLKQVISSQQRTAHKKFFLYFQRKCKLKLDTDIAAWLYGTAKNEIKQCLRKNKHDNVSVDDLTELPQKTQENTGLFDEVITDDEYSTLENYYLNGEDVSKLAEDKKISVSAMYQRIHRIKQKIIENSDKLHNLMNK